MFVGIGGAFGAMTRFHLCRFFSARTDSTFSLSTFFVNISGAILLGIITAINIPGNLYMLFGDGFLGAYTTFSTFMFESVHFFRDSRKNAAAYILMTVFLGILGYIIGFYGFAALRSILF